MKSEPSASTDNYSMMLTDRKRSIFIIWSIRQYLQDLDGTRSGTVTGAHVSVGLGDGVGGVGGSVLTVHVVRAGS